MNSPADAIPLSPEERNLARNLGVSAISLAIVLAILGLIMSACGCLGGLNNLVRPETIMMQSPMQTRVGAIAILFWALAGALMLVQCGLLFAAYTPAQALGTEGLATRETVKTLVSKLRVIFFVEAAVLAIHALASTIQGISGFLS